ncbi:MAG: hypothetical protein HY593_00825 [Candidatus Omnitrophica bacterium]|nr:hypothetical protein [Candidatus Omnitrophota bacterium]
MKKFFLILLGIIALLLVGFVILIFLLPASPPRLDSKPPYHKVIDPGYAPFKMRAHKDWVPDDRYDFGAFRRKLSADLPESNFNIQIQKLVDVTGQHYIGINEYVDNYLIKGLKQSFRVEVLSIKDFTVDVFLGKDIIYKHLLTIQGLTREIKARMIIFIAGEYVYSLTLGSFEKDFDQANREFEEMVRTFRFINEEQLPTPRSQESLG